MPSCSTAASRNCLAKRFECCCQCYLARLEWMGPELVSSHRISLAMVRYFRGRHTVGLAARVVVATDSKMMAAAMVARIQTPEDGLDGMVVDHTFVGVCRNWNWWQACWVNCRMVTGYDSALGCSLRLASTERHRLVGVWLGVDRMCCVFLADRILCGFASAVKSG